MKKILFSFFCFSFIGLTSIDAQFSIGIKGGMNTSTVKMANEPDLPDGQESFNDTRESLIGWQAGIQYGYRINNLEINWDMLFAQKGYTYVYGNPFTQNTEKTDMRYQYISLPATTRFYITNGFYAGLGLETSILVSAKSHNEDGETVDLIEFGERVGLEYNRIDFGPLVEIGVKIKDRLGIQLRYVHGINNIYADDLQFTDINGEPLGEPNIRYRNRSVQLSVTADLVVIN
jgi:hypothetical protein